MTLFTAADITRYRVGTIDVRSTNLDAATSTVVTCYALLQALFSVDR